MPVLYMFVVEWFLRVLRWWWADGMQMGVTGTQRIFRRSQVLTCIAGGYCQTFFFFKLAPLLTVVLGQDFAFWLRCFSSGLQCWNHRSRLFQRFAGVFLWNGAARATNGTSARKPWWEIGHDRLIWKGSHNPRSWKLTLTMLIHHLRYVLGSSSK